MAPPTEVETPVEGRMVNVAGREATCNQSRNRKQFNFVCLQRIGNIEKAPLTVVEVFVEGRRGDSVDGGGRWVVSCIHTGTVSR
jgi:hypothetical protein